MNCTDSALVGIGLLGASIYTSFVPPDELNKLRNILTGDALAAYQRINDERSSIYFQGLAIGFLLVVLFNSFYGSQISNSFHKSCLFILIILSFSLFYYTLMPKSDYMLNHLTNSEQNKAWLDVYKTMKNRYATGFLLGMAAAVPLSYSLC